MMEVLKVAVEREAEEDGFELSLELTIGGSYGKSVNAKKMELRKEGPFEESDGDVSRSDFSCKSKKMNLEREGGMILEDQQFQARAEERENRERNGTMEPVNISDFSAASDYQSMSQKGSSSSDSRETYPSISNTHQIASRNNTFKRLKVDDSNSQTKPNQRFDSIIQEQCTKVVPPSMPPHPHKPSSARSDQPSKQTSGLFRKPPKPPNHSTNGVSIRQMPCVSTTGNGPNGKTITGFLCKYTKTEVRIMCVCHGRFFSPTEFVEHAGGVGISNPLRHITIVDSAR